MALICFFSFLFCVAGWPAVSVQIVTYNRPVWLQQAQGFLKAFLTESAKSFIKGSTKGSIKGFWGWGLELRALHEAFGFRVLAWVQQADRHI